MNLTAYFTQQELQKNAGLLSFLRLSTIAKFIKYLASAIKKIMTWATITYGVSNVGEIYDKATTDPSALFEDGVKPKLNPFRQNEGPFENLFRIATYAFPAFSGLFGGGMMLLLDKILSKEYGAGFEDLGKLLDHKLGLKAGDEVNVDESKLERTLGDLFKIEQPKEEKYDNSMTELKQLLGD